MFSDPWLQVNRVDDLTACNYQESFEDRLNSLIGAELAQGEDKSEMIEALEAAAAKLKSK